jgi:hypothetical protein
MPVPTHVSWVRTLGTEGEDSAQSVAVLADGSLAVVGSFGERGFIYLYNDDGTIRWNKKVWSSTTVYCTDVAIGADGYIYVVGSTWGLFNGLSPSGHRPPFTFDATKTGGSDGFLLKVDPVNGNTIWTKLFGSEKPDEATAIATHRDGSIYVAGYTTLGFDGTVVKGGYGSFLIKFDSSGNKIWTRVIDSTAEDYAYDVAAAVDGSVYVVGTTTGSLDPIGGVHGLDAFVSRVSTDGTILWNKQFSPTFGSTQAFSIATSSDGAIYLAGQSFSGLDGKLSSGGADAFVTRIDSNGLRIWTQMFGAALFDDLARSITVGPDNYVYVVGTTHDSAMTSKVGSPYAFMYKSTDVFYAVFSDAGSRIFSSTYMGLGTSGKDAGNAISVSSDGSFYIVGDSTGQFGWGTTKPQGGEDAFVAKFSNDLRNFNSGTLETILKIFAGSYTLSESYVMTQTDNAADLQVVRLNGTWVQSFRTGVQTLLLWHQYSPNGNRTLDGLTLDQALAALDLGLAGTEREAFVQLIGLIADCKIVNGVPLFDGNFG